MHCFEYGRGEQPELNKYCQEVYYYKRKKLVNSIPLNLPYIVSSRINPLLIKNISKDHYPVLLEGIHCSYYLYHGELNDRKVLVRLHNVEFEYYRQLSNSTNNFYKQIYYALESTLLKKYEKKLAGIARFLAVNEKDKATYQKVFSAKDVKFLPVFLPFNQVNSKTGKGNFCLYHGNLSVAENDKAAFWLINIFDQLHKITLVIAGKNPSKDLIKECKKHKNVKLIQNPGAAEMEDLIKNAHIHLLPSYNSTGIKIKLLNALFNGRFIITNPSSIEGTGFENLCSIEETPSGYIKKIEELLEISFDENEKEKRKAILENLYNNQENAGRLIKMFKEE